MMQRDDVDLSASGPARLIGADCCLNCRFFRLHPGGAAKCHALPPTAMLIVGKGPNGLPAHLATMSDWPPTHPDNWCGAHRRSVVLSS